MLISWLCSSRSLCLGAWAYVWLLALECLCIHAFAWLMSLSLVPLNACICRGCLATVCEDPTQKSLSNISALILNVIRCNANLLLPEPRSLFLANHFVALSTKSLSSVSALSLESHLFCLQISQVSECLLVLISYCCPTRLHLILLFYLVISLVKTRHAWKIYVRVSRSVVFIS